MQRYESTILRNDVTAQGYIDWTTAEYLHSVGKDAEDAANRQVAQGRYKRT